VPPYYDSLLMLVITAGKDRADAIRVMDRCLGRNLRVEGVKTLQPLLLSIIRHPAFVAGEFSTRFIEEHLAELVATFRDRSAEDEVLKVARSSEDHRGPARGGGCERETARPAPQGAPVRPRVSRSSSARHDARARSSPPCAPPGVADHLGRHARRRSPTSRTAALRRLATLAPHYERMGSSRPRVHGGARWHVGMNRRESPFEEIARFRELMPSVLLQTLIRETNLFGYRPYPRRVIEHVVARVDIDVWRCFSFLNDVRNMRAVAEVVLARGRLFQPTISFTSSDWATDAYYLGVVRDIVALCGGTDEIVLCIKDMAGVGSITRIGRLSTRSAAAPGS
jgi:pyruvate carboxylase